MITEVGNRLLARLAAAGLCCVIASTAVADLDLQIDEARRLSITDPTGRGTDLLAEINDRDGEASPRQRAEIELLNIRNIALQGRTMEAIERARTLSANAPGLSQRVTAQRLGAQMALDAGDYELAFDLLRSALEGLQGIDSPTDEVRVYGTASTFHSRSGDTRLAMDYAEKALVRARGTGDPRLECLASTWMGQAHAALGDPATAQAFGEQALSLCLQAGDPITSTQVRLLLARLALEAGQLDQAQDWLGKAAADQPAPLPDLWTETEILRAQIELERGDNLSALDRFQNLSKSLGASQRLSQLSTVLGGAADAARRLGELQTALAFYKSSLAVRREYIDQVNSLRLSQLAIDFDQALNNQEIELLRERQRYRDLRERSQSQRRQLVTLATIGALILALILIAGLAYTLRERRRYQRLSDRDGLTQLFNHTRFFNQFEREMSERGYRPLILILADVDHFKQVNDRFGHQIGDEVLRQTARLLREVFGEEQLIGRIGGEEFAVRLLGQSRAAAEERVEVLRRRLGGKERRRTDPPITLSFGLGVLAEGETLEQLRLRTDNALYRAKAQGRNRLVISEPERGDDT
jgi:diguanylate cyclase (GGDEF)-like protein